MKKKQSLSENTNYIEPVKQNDPLIYNKAEKAGYVIDQLVNAHNYDVNGALNVICRSGYDVKWYEDDPRWFSSRFPDEITEKILATDGKSHLDQKPDFQYGMWSEFWTGWMLTFVMDATSWTLPYILEVIPGKELEDMYWPYHEMDVSKAINEVISRVKAHYGVNNV